VATDLPRPSAPLSFGRTVRPGSATWCWLPSRRYRVSIQASPTRRGATHGQRGQTEKCKE
jgi:hypothetical protein